MKKVLIAYSSKTGTTESMAQYIAEGVRIAGHEAELRRMEEVKEESDFAGYDGYLFGCPTYHLDLPKPAQTLLSLAEKAHLNGKAGGAFSSRSHPSSNEGSAAAIMYETMETKLGMRMINLGPFDLKQEWLTSGKPDLEDNPKVMRACQAYGRALGEMLATS